MEESEDARRERLLRSQRTARWVLITLAVLAPLGLHLLFEREARRLDSIGEFEHALHNRSSPAAGSPTPSSRASDRAVV